MRYQDMAAKEYHSPAEMRASYSATRSKFRNDPQMVSSLRLALDRERLRHKADVERLEAELVSVRSHLARMRSENVALSDRLAIANTNSPMEAVTCIDRKKYAFQRILEIVCRAHDITVAEIKSTDRTFNVCRARMHLIHVLTIYRPDLSGSRVGRLLNKDHSSVLYARKRWPHVRHIVAPAIAEFEREIEKNIGPMPHAVDSADNRRKIKT